MRSHIGRRTQCDHNLTSTWHRTDTRPVSSAGCRAKRCEGLVLPVRPANDELLHSRVHCVSAALWGYEPCSLPLCPRPSEQTPGYSEPGQTIACVFSKILITYLFINSVEQIL